MQELRLEAEPIQEKTQQEMTSTLNDQGAVPEMDLWAGGTGEFPEYTLGSAPKPSLVSDQGLAAKRKRLVIYSVSGLVALLLISFLMFDEDGTMVGGAFVSEEQFDFEAPAPKKNKPAKVVDKEEFVAPAVAVDPVLPEPVVANGELNPYWNLPNEIVQEKIVLNGQWSAQEEDIWRAGLNHKFVYQRYKTVMEVKQALLAGSEVILWDALKQPKLWIRMRAVMGLVDFGVPVSFDVVEQSIGKAPPDLVNRFLKRFIVNSTYGERFMIRQFIRLLNEDGRVIALRALKNHPNDLRDLYMIAATYDSSPKVQKWLKEHMPDIAPKKSDYYRQVVMGKASYQYQFLQEGGQKDEQMEGGDMSVEDVVIYDITDDQQS